MTIVFVDWPIYTETSNGIKCLYELSHELRKRGFSVIGVPRDIKQYRKCINYLPPHFRDIPVVSLPFGSADNVLIVSETAPRNILAAARVKNIRIAWWQLAPYCLLERTQLPRVGEISMPFSSYTEPGVDFYFYFQPALSAEWENSIKAPIADQAPNRSLLIYSGKARLKRLPELLLDACSRFQIKLITRSAPTTRKELFRLMKCSHGLITFDELTNLNLEAASMGLPVFLANPLFPVESRQQFSISGYIENVCLTAEVFLHRVEERISGSFSTISVNDLLGCNIATVEMIERIIENQDEARQFLVRDCDRLKYRLYVESLKRKRVIFAHIGGHAGGSLLFKSYCYQLQKGKISPPLLLGIRMLDYLYCHLNFLLVPLATFSLRIIKFFQATSRSIFCSSSRPPTLD
jgi:hypothetical protein